MTFGLVGMTGLLAASFTQIVMGMALGFVCVLLMMIILIQKGRGGGLTSAFGGGGGGGGAFGAKTGDVFTGITVVLAFVFLLLTVFGNYVMRPEGANTGANALQSGRTVPAGGAAVPAVTTDADSKPAAVLIPDAVKKDADGADSDGTDTDGANSAGADAGQPNADATDEPAAADVQDNAPVEDDAPAGDDAPAEDDAPQDDGGQDDSGDGDTEAMP